jgi:AraC family transcriptional regulator
LEQDADEFGVCALSSASGAIFNPSAGYRLPAYSSPENDLHPNRPAGHWTAASDEPPSFASAANLVEIHPISDSHRRSIRLDGIAADIVQANCNEKLELRFRGSDHLLIVYEQGSRAGGHTSIDGQQSSLRELGRKLSFVPAGREYREHLQPRKLTRLMFFYLNSEKFHLCSTLRSAEADLECKLFFEDSALFETALKLKRVFESPSGEDGLYIQALGEVLTHELIYVARGRRQVGPRLTGGLAARQQRLVTTYIEEHLSQPISLSTLAGLARLSPFHFCRAFKRSFGIPPHRYHTARRIEHAKALLADHSHSVTDIGLLVGYSETSSFTIAFRKLTGLTPTAYRRSL